jgi:hypothetical protein
MYWTWGSHSCDIKEYSLQECYITAYSGRHWYCAGRTQSLFRRWTRWYQLLLCSRVFKNKCHYQDFKLHELDSLVSWNNSDTADIKTERVQTNTSWCPLYAAWAWYFSFMTQFRHCWHADRVRTNASWCPLYAAWARYFSFTKQLRHRWHADIKTDRVRTNTSWCPLYAAWCRLVRPPRSVTLMLGNRGIRLWAQWTALLAAATWSGVCQCLSLALISALCFRRTSTASWNRRAHTVPSMRSNLVTLYLERNSRVTLWAVKVIKIVQTLIESIFYIKFKLDPQTSRSIRFCLSTPRHTGVKKKKKNWEWRFKLHPTIAHCCNRRGYCTYWQNSKLQVNFTVDFNTLYSICSSKTWNSRENYTFYILYAFWIWKARIRFTHPSTNNGSQTTEQILFILIATSVMNVYIPETN